MSQVPHTCYPTALPDAVVWGLFTLACVGTVIAQTVVIRQKGAFLGFLLTPIIAVAAIIATSFIGVVITFFTHAV